MAKIPPQIWQTWKTKDVPAHWQPSVAAIKKHMPHFVHTLHTDSDNRKFIATYYPEFLSHYDKFPYPIQRADFIRYALLHKHGGIYMDLDIELKGDISSFFPHTGVYLVPSGNTAKTFTNSFMASSAGENFWLAVMQETTKSAPWWAVNKELYVLNTTGPGALTRVAHSGQFAYHVLPQKQIQPYSICDKVFDKEDAMTQPLPGSSWVSPLTQRVTSCAFCNPYGVALVFILILLLIFLVTLLIRQK